MKTILLPTDFSQPARKAFAYASKLFKGKNDVRFVLVHAYEVPSKSGMLISIEDLVKSDVESQLIDEVKFLTEELGMTKKLETFVYEGDIDEALEAAVKKYEANLIIMGTKGASGVKEFFIGSNATKVIRKAICPVIAVPEDALEERPGKILIPVDSERLSEESVKRIKEFALTFNAEVEVLNVASEKSDELVDRNKLESFFDQQLNGPELSYTYQVSNDVVGNIMDALSDECDMIVMFPHRNNFFDSIFHKSVTNKIASRTNVPLMAIHEL